LGHCHQWYPTGQRPGSIVISYIHQGAPRTDKQTCACDSDLGEASHVTCSLSLLSDLYYDHNAATVYD